MKFYFDNYLQEKLKELKKKIKAIRRKVEKAIKNIKEEFELAAFRLQRRVRISVAKLKDAVKNHIEEIPPLIDDAFTVKNPSKAARMAEIYGEELSSALYDTQLRIEGMQNAIIRAAVPIAQAVVPIVNTAVRALTVLANTVGKIISAFLEGSLGIKAYENSLKSAVRTTGSMERYLAGFDQIERLGSGGGEGLTSALIPDTDQVIPGWEKLVEKIKSLVKPLGSINFTPAIEETKRALSALQPVLDTVMEAIGWAFSNILVPVAQWAAENILPAFLEVLTTAFQTLGQIIEQLKPTLTWLWENWLQKLAQWYGDKIIRDIQAVGEKIQNTGDFIRNNLPTFDTIIRKIGEILDLGVSLQTDAGLWENMLKTLIPSITTMSQGLGTLPGPLGAILPVLGNFLPTLGNVTGGFQGMKENEAEALSRPAPKRYKNFKNKQKRIPIKELIKQIRDYAPDIIHLHNLHGCYINVDVLFRFLKIYGKPVVWTLHDCWPFTGHCAHFAVAGCEKWKTGCYDCPQRKSYPVALLLDQSKRNYLAKKKLFTQLGDLTIVTPSHWLAELVQQSFLNKCRIEVIHNGIDTKVFKPSATEFRKKHGLENKRIVLGVASSWDARKGFDDFLSLAEMLGSAVQMVMVGLSQEQCLALPDNILGITRTDSTKELAELYSSADVFVNLTYEDTYPTVNLEAQACGTPVITYRTGGSVESVPEANVVEQGDLQGVANKIRRLDCPLAELDFEKNSAYETYIHLYEELL